MNEAVDKIRELVRYHESSETLSFQDDLMLYTGTRKMMSGGQTINLTPSETTVLAAAMVSTRAVSRTVMYDVLYWNRSDDEKPDVQTISVIICHFRKKLKKIGYDLRSPDKRGWRLEKICHGEAQ
jgi:DNA-binding response OmpR family regulator